MPKWWVYVYDRNRQLSVGITEDLQSALREHRAAVLYSEECEDELSASRRQRQLRGWSRKKLIRLARRGTP